jgi:S-adenosylmethionine:tRNA ribosyltransferase-isomerase
MQLSEFHYSLPDELIAQRPLPERDASRMLVLNRASQVFSDSQFQNLPDYVRPGDVLVVNNTRVFPARLIGEREPSGGRVELLLIRELGDAVWEALARPAQRLKVGAKLRFGDSALRAEVIECAEKGVRRLRFAVADGDNGELEHLLHTQGQTPLPHYIQRVAGTRPEDNERYQTLFAREKGAIAAPTAGLHFTPAILSALQTCGARVAEITLHVGYGTFEPVRVAEVAEHRVAAESFHITNQTADTINETRANGGRVIAVGTTTTRALESSVDEAGSVRASAGETDLTITPGHEFRVVDALLTNFHLPHSSLLLLVCAFAGRDFTLEAYHHAVAEHYRFYSYGDCMFVI